MVFFASAWATYYAVTDLPVAFAHRPFHSPLAHPQRQVLPCLPLGLRSSLNGLHNLCCTPDNGLHNLCCTKKMRPWMLPSRVLSTHVDSEYVCTACVITWLIIDNTFTWYIPCKQAVICRNRFETRPFLSVYDIFVRYPLLAHDITWVLHRRQMMFLILWITWTGSEIWTKIIKCSMNFKTNVYSQRCIIMLFISSLFTLCYSSWVPIIINDYETMEAPPNRHKFCYSPRKFMMILTVVRAHIIRW